MYNNQDRNHYETYEDWAENPAGKAMLKMPWLWEDGDYPKKAHEAVAPDTGVVSRLQPVRENAGIVPVEASITPYKAESHSPAAGSASGFSGDGNDAAAYLNNIKTAYETQRAITDSLIEKRKQQTASLPDLTTTQTAREKPAISAFPADQTPYRNMGQLMQPASDKVINNVLDPAVRKLADTARNKESAGTAPEEDLVNVTGAVTKPVRTALKNTYTRDNLIKAADAIHQGETLGQEASFKRPPEKSGDIMAAIHQGETLGHENNFRRPDLDAFKGFDRE